MNKFIYIICNRQKIKWAWGCDNFFDFTGLVCMQTLTFIFFSQSKTKARTKMMMHVCIKWMKTNSLTPNEPICKPCGFWITRSSWCCSKQNQFYNYFQIESPNWLCAFHYIGLRTSQQNLVPPWILRNLRSFVYKISWLSWLMYVKLLNKQTWIVTWCIINYVIFNAIRNVHYMIASMIVLYYLGF